MPDFFLTKLKLMARRKVVENINNANNESYTVYLPNGLDIDQSMAARPLKTKYYMNNIQRQKENLLYIIGSISTKYKQGFHAAELSATILQSVVSDYTIYIEWLIENDIITTSDHYIPGLKNKSYHFTNLPEGYVAYKLSEQKLISKIVKSLEKRPIHSDIKYLFFEKHFENLTFCESSLKQIIKDKPELKPKIDQIKKKLNQNKYMIKIDRTGRLHSVVTHMPKDLRTALRWRGEKLVEVDMKTAVPSLLYSLYNYYNKEAISTSYQRYLLKGEGYSGEESHIMLKNLSFEKAKYKQCIEGDIYDYMVDKWKIHNKNMNRDMAKEKILSVIFSPSNFNNKYRQTFVKEFPCLMSRIDYINRGFNKTRKQGRTWAEKCPLAMIMFNMEAEHININVCRMLDTQYGDIALFTIFDAVLTNEKYKSKVRQMIDDLPVRRHEINFEVA